MDRSVIDTIKTHEEITEEENELAEISKEEERLAELTASFDDIEARVSALEASMKAIRASTTKMEGRIDED